MKKQMTAVPFTDTPEQKKQLDEVIESLRNEKGCLMPIMQKAQDIYGYLPPEVQKHIALALEIPVSEVYGVATFYSQFLLNPKGEHPINVCLGTACYVKGSGNLMDKCKEILNIEVGGITPDKKFSLDATRCVGACGLAPVLMIGEDVYGRLTPDDVKGIIEKYN